MQGEEVKALLESGLDDCEVQVEEVDPGKFRVTVIGSAFAGLRRVKREQLAAAPLRDAFSDGRVHAVSWRVLTPDEASARGA